MRLSSETMPEACTICEGTIREGDFYVIDMGILECKVCWDIHEDEQRLLDFIDELKNSLAIAIHKDRIGTKFSRDMLSESGKELR